MVARAIYAAKTPIISGTGHEVDTTIADYAADLRAATPTAACELAVPDLRETLDAIDARRRSLSVQIRHILRNYELRLEQYSGKLRSFDPKLQLQEQRMTLAELEDRLTKRMDFLRNRYQHRLELYAQRLHGLSPTAKLIGGYGYLSDQSGRPVVSATQISKGDEVQITISDGSIKTKVTQVIPREK